jgi:hypothetical protein
MRRSGRRRAIQVPLWSPCLGAHGLIDGPTIHRSPGTGVAAAETATAPAATTRRERKGSASERQAARPGPARRGRREHRGRRAAEPARAPGPAQRRGRRLLAPRRVSPTGAAHGALRGLGHAHGGCANQAHRPEPPERRRHGLNAPICRRQPPERGARRPLSAGATASEPLRARPPRGPADRDPACVCHNGSDSRGGGAGSRWMPSLAPDSG